MLRLHDWAPSPFCHKVRAILAYKGLAYERLPVTVARMQDLAERGANGKVPVLEIDGVLVSDSTAIALAVDGIQPEPPLMPASSREAALCQVLEDWADEAIYFNGLHYHWRDPAGRTQTAAYFAGQGPEIAPMFDPLAALTADQLVGHGTARRIDDVILDETSKQMASVASLVSVTPFLMGEQPYLCDFAVVAQVVYLSRAPTTAAMIAAQPALTRYVETMKALTR